MSIIADSNLVTTWRQNIFQNENELIVSFVLFISSFSHSLLSYTLRWRQFTTWHLLCDFPSLGRTFSPSVGNVENGWKGDFLFSFLFWQTCRLEVLKWEWKLLLNGSHVFQSNSSQCQRQGTQGTVYRISGVWLTYPRAAVAWFELFQGDWPS